LVPINPPTVKTVTKPGVTPISQPLQALVGVPYPILEDLFDRVRDTAFFVKDRHGRYVACNQSLVGRVGLKDKAELIGRTVTEIFPSGLAEQYRIQDAAVLNAGKPVSAGASRPNSRFSIPSAPSSDSSASPAISRPRTTLPRSRPD
jgi:PAS domain-containing protein